MALPAELPTHESRFYHSLGSALPGAQSPAARGGILTFMPTRRLDRSAADFLPKQRTLPQLRAAAAACQGCELYLRGTQAVFGEGAAHATALFLGQPPGDQVAVAG